MHDNGASGIGWGQSKVQLFYKMQNSYINCRFRRDNWDTDFLLIGKENPRPSSAFLFQKASENDKSVQVHRVVQCYSGAGGWPACVQALPNWILQIWWTLLQETCERNLQKDLYPLDTQKPCKYFALNKFCKFGEACCYQHSSDPADSYVSPWASQNSADHSCCIVRICEGSWGTDCEAEKYKQMWLVWLYCIFQHWIKKSHQQEAQKKLTILPRSGKEWRKPFWFSPFVSSSCWKGRTSDRLFPSSSWREVHKLRLDLLQLCCKLSQWHDQTRWHSTHHHFLFCFPKLQWKRSLWVVWNRILHGSYIHMLCTCTTTTTQALNAIIVTSTCLVVRVVFLRFTWNCAQPHVMVIRDALANGESVTLVWSFMF